MEYYHIKNDDTGKQLLRKLKVKGCQMALDINMEHGKLSRILNGWHVPKDQEIRQKIARYLGTSPDALWPDKADAAQPITGNTVA